MEGGREGRNGVGRTEEGEMDGGGGREINGVDGVSHLLRSNARASVESYRSNYGSSVLNSYSWS